MNNPLEVVKLLSWAILEAKFAYYHPAKIDPSWKRFVSIPDAEYDMLEDIYRMMCEKYLISPTASDMVDFNSDNPSCKLVMSKLTAPRKNNISCIEEALNIL